MIELLKTGGTRGGERKENWRVSSDHRSGRGQRGKGGHTV